MSKHQTTPQKEVGYYNILYKLDNKENRDNILANEATSSADEDNTCLSSSSGLASLSASQDIPPQVEVSSLGVGNLAKENPEEDLRDLCEDQIKRAIVQFFDNGEGTPQRFKIKVRLNLTDKDNPEFIATLTKDWSNFTKYIPLECKDQIKDFAQKFKAQIKKDFNIAPYLGKFHLNQGRRPDVNRAFTQIEPWTVSAVWYDNENAIWHYYLQIQDWIRSGTFSSAHLTAAQQKIGVKGQDLFVNEKYETRQRPKTWAEIRAEKRAAK
jgi:hypothetical protein